eukprot:COSAG02_NODE_3354_length_6883_cov_188.063237_4_plen_168_part_00
MLTEQADGDNPQSNPACALKNAADGAQLADGAALAAFAAAAAPLAAGQRPLRAEHVSGELAATSWLPAGLGWGALARQCGGCSGRSRLRRWRTAARTAMAAHRTGFASRGRALVYMVTVERRAVRRQTLARGQSRCDAGRAQPAWRACACVWICATIRTCAASTASA